MDKLREAHELLQRLRDQHPNDTEEELSRRFAAAVRGDSMISAPSSRIHSAICCGSPNAKGRTIELII